MCLNKNSLVVLPFLFLSIQHYCFSQDSLKFTDNLHIQALGHIGANVPEYKFLSYLSDEYVKCFDFALVKKTRGKRIWESVYGYPEYGLSLFYTDLGNDEYLGKQLALTYFFRVNFLEKNRFRFFNRTGIGLNYTTKKFDLITNYLNVGVGSNVNIHFNLRFGLGYQISDRLEGILGTSFDHFSNANTSEPNLGINYASIYSGINYRIGAKTEKKMYDLKDYDPLNYQEIFLSFGGKHTRELSNSYYFTSSVSYSIKRSFWRGFHIGIGADLFYDSSVKNQLRNSETEYKGYHQFQTGLHVSQSIVYNRFTITFQEGLYIGLVEKVDGYKMYNRGILKYNFNDQISIRLAMKSHLYILDYPEIGFGLKL